MGMVKVGDRLKMLNFVECVDAEAAMAKLDGCVEAQLSVIRSETPSAEKTAAAKGGDSQQLRALLKRTRLLQFRQYGLCMCSFVVPALCMGILIAYQVFVINNAGGWLAGLFDFQEQAFGRGCRNSTAQMKAMCEQKVDVPPEALNGEYFYPNCSWCEDTFTRFKTPGGRVVDSCRGTLINDFSPGAKGDQCVYKGSQPTPL